MPCVARLQVLLGQILRQIVVDRRRSALRIGHERVGVVGAMVASWRAGRSSKSLRAAACCRCYPTSPLAVRADFADMTLLPSRAKHDPRNPHRALPEYSPACRHDEAEIRARPQDLHRANRTTAPCPGSWCWSWRPRRGRVSRGVRRAAARFRASCLRFATRFTTSRRSPRRSRPASSPCVRSPPVGWPSTRLRSSCCPSSPVPTTRAQITVRQLAVSRIGPACAPAVLAAGRGGAVRALGGVAAGRARAARIPARRSRRLLRPRLHLARLVARATDGRPAWTCSSRPASPRPLALTSTMFMNLVDDPAARARTLSERSIAATQHCAERRRVLIGEVDDLNAMAMGGVAGHAGLFSTAADLSAIAAALVPRLARRRWRRALVPRDVVRAFWTPSGVPESTWRSAGTGRRRPARRPGRGFRARRSATSASPAARCGSIPSARRGSSAVEPRPPVGAEPTIASGRFRPALHDAILGQRWVL